MKKILSSLFILGLVLAAVPASAEELNVTTTKVESKKMEIKNVLKENKEAKKEITKKAVEEKKAIQQKAVAERKALNEKAKELVNKLKEEAKKKQEAKKVQVAAIKALEKTRFDAKAAALKEYNETLKKANADLKLALASSTDAIARTAARESYQATKKVALQKLQTTRKAADAAFKSGKEALLKPVSVPATTPAVTSTVTSTN